jgi:hypothetical protein
MNLENSCTQCEIDIFIPAYLKYMAALKWIRTAIMPLQIVTQ